MQKELIDYIKSGTEKGYSFDDLKKILLSNGWSVSEIDEAIKSIQAPAQPPIAKPMAQPEKPIAKPAEIKPKPLIQPVEKPAIEAKPMAQPEERPIIGAAKRPTMLTVICIMGFILSIAIIIMAAMSFFVTNVIGTIVGQLLPPELLPTPGLSTILNILWILIGIVGFVGFIFLWKLKKLGFWVILLTGIVAIIASIISLNILSIIDIVIWILILVYIIIKRSLFI